MSHESPDSEIIESKDIEGSHELLKVRLENGIQALILAKKGTKGGSFFGGHNWERLGAHADMVGDFYDSISTIEQFVKASFRVRERIQGLVEEDKV